MSTTRSVSAKERVSNYIRDHGPIPTVRVSSVQGPRKYPYWAPVRYEVVIRDGVPAHRPAAGACEKKRASKRLARQEAEEIAAQEGRIIVEWRIGPLNEKQCEDILVLMARVAGIAADVPTEVLWDLALDRGLDLGRYFGPSDLTREDLLVLLSSQGVWQ